MICNNCKAEIENGSEFCNHCGAPVTAGEPVSELQPAAYGEQDIAAEADCPSPIKILTFGIIGLALSPYGIPGIILSALGLNFANKRISRFGSDSVMAKVGRILALVGLIRSIVWTMFWTAYICLYGTYFLILFSQLSTALNHIY